MTTSLFSTVMRGCESKLWRGVLSNASRASSSVSSNLFSQPPIQSKKLKTTSERLIGVSNSNLSVISRNMAVAKAAAELTEIAKQNYDYFLVLDFEATCDRIRTVQPQEIIEFPCIKLNGKTLEVESYFHQYVQPRINRELTSFCIELTGINQDMIANQPDIEATLKLFENWLVKEGVLKDDVKFTFVTCGDWDLDIMLPNECNYFKLNVPTYMRSWINIKKPFVNVTGIWPKGLLHMMSTVGMKHEGRLHSGLDDCRNLSKVLKYLGQKGYVLDITGLHDY